MAIRKSKINIDTEERSDFDNMMDDVENEIEEQQAEDGLVSRVPELKQLSEDIDKATSTFINATLELKSAIQQYQRAEVQLGGAVTTIGKKVDTINQHINKVLENAPNQLKVSVNVNDADWQKIQELFAKERQWMTALTSSLRTPKIFIKEFGDFLMSCHQHCLGVNLLVQR